jgi:hypothetical protein
MESGSEGSHETKHAPLQAPTSLKAPFVNTAVLPNEAARDCERGHCEYTRKSLMHHDWGGPTFKPAEFPGEGPP